MVYIDTCTFNRYTEYEFIFSKLLGGMQMKNIKKVSKRHEILEATAKMISTNGYNESSIKDITSLAGYSVGTFYLYFKNKEEALLAIYDEAFSEQCKVIEKILKIQGISPIEKYVTIVSAMLYSYNNNSDITLVLLTKTAGIDKIFEEKYFHIVSMSKKMIEEMLQYFNDNKIVKVSNLHMTAAAILQVMNSLAVDWLRSEEEYSIEEVVYEIVEFNMNAIKLSFNKEEIVGHIHQLFQNNFFEKMGEEEYE